MEKIKGKKSDSFRESIVIKGKIIKSPVFKRKTDCKNWLINMRDKKSKFKLHGEGDKFYQKVSIDEYASQWLETKRTHGVARSTEENYKRYVNVHIVPFFKGMDLKAIQKRHVEEFQAQLMQNHNPKGVNIIITALKGLFREAMREEYIIKSPCEFIKSLSSDNVHDVYWTTDEINQFLRANHDNELYDFFLVALNTGCRKGELAGLCWDRVNFSENTITITRTRDKYELKERTKTNLKRVIPMTQIVRTTLLNLFNNRPDDSRFVFLNLNGEPIETHHIYRKFRRAQKIAKIGNVIRFHDIRHTAASQFIQSGRSIYDLQKILGHSSVVMTQRYAHLSIGHLQETMKGFALGEVNPKNNSDLSDIVIFRKKESSDELTQKSPKIQNLV